MIGAIGLTRSTALLGKSIIVSGTTQIRNDSGIIDPQWECFIDDVSIGSKAPSHGVLTDGPFVFRLEAKVAKEQTFWFDFLNYIPSSSVPLDTSTVFYDQSDSTVQYNPGQHSGLRTGENLGIGEVPDFFSLLRVFARMVECMVEWRG